jgi:hypothetical protein
MPTKNRTTAHMWVHISASLRGKDGAKAIEFVQGFMSLPDIFATQKLARACVRKKYKGC